MAVQSDVCVWEAFYGGWFVEPLSYRAAHFAGKIVGETPHHLPTGEFGWFVAPSEWRNIFDAFCAAGMRVVEPCGAPAKFPKRGCNSNV